jgi:hypothetical protein
MPETRAFNRWLLRPVMLLLAVAQLFVVIAPSFDRADDRDSGIHMEAEGTRQHYVHDDAACPACQAQHLVGGIIPPSHVVPVAVIEPTVRPVTFMAFSSGRDHHIASPRAPPVTRVV